MSYDVFISYSSKDKHAADAACAVLERNGIRCWIAPRDVLPGMTWGAAIVAAIHQVKLFVLVFSGSANTSPQIEREVERAINDGIPVIPFRIKNVKPSNIAALVFKMAPQRATVQASAAAPGPIQPPGVQLASAPPANIPPPGAQAPAAPPASAPPANAPPPVAQTASAAPAAASPPAPQPSAVSLSGRWDWLADCSSTRWRGKFDIAAAAQGQFTGNFAGTVWYDVGTITDGKMDGAGVSFTRTAGAYVQYWKGQVAPGRMQGSLTYGNETCSWEASRD